MSDTRVSVLTPPGTGAIATVAVAGPRAWGIARWLFRPAGTRPLPESPEPRRVWFGTLGEGTGDEVVLAVKQTEPEPVVEVHCHGGRRVVRWVVEQFTERGCVELASGGLTPPELTLASPIGSRPLGGLTPPARLLPYAPTLRTASILLDQYHGAFDRAVRGILTRLETGNPEDARRELEALAAFAPVGRHLVGPWKVVVAGPPNVGKSSLVNALAGYQRAVVSEVAGTTRDVVTTAVAFDGWPVELAGTAGLRDAAGLEAEGVERAERVLSEADLVLWAVDGSDPHPVWPAADTFPRHPRQQLIGVVTKSDLPAAWDTARSLAGVCVSARTGAGIPLLASAVALVLVPHAPPAGAAVPYSPQLADLVESAYAALSEGRTADATARLRAAVTAD